LNSFDEIREVASRALRIEANAVEGLIAQLDDAFAETVQSILACEGRVVITGIGKSAIIAQKIVATLNSTGTPSTFLHAADAIHGDLGMVTRDDVVICISKSGNTPEIKALVPLLRPLCKVLVGMAGNPDSFLAQGSDFVLQTHVAEEACPNNLAPTTSTTVQMALGDALAVCLMHCRGFTSEDFARYHPGGALGKRLYVKVGDLVDRENAPRVNANTLIREVIMEISSKRLGATAVVSGDKLAGVITDGDLRRMLQKGGSIEQISAAEVMNASPKTIDAAELAVGAFGVMEEHNITQLLVMDGARYLGIVHLHDILKEGIF